MFHEAQKAGLWMGVGIIMAIDDFFVVYYLISLMES
jgi:hypothetical protein